MRLIDAEPLENLLHSRAAQCSNDYGSLAGAISGCLKLVQVQPTITPPPNPPLTLEDLREMDGEPVYIYFGSGFGEWALVLARSELYDEVSLRLRNGLPSPARFVFEGGGNIYRRKPEEDAHGS